VTQAQDPEAQCSSSVQWQTLGAWHSVDRGTRWTRSRWKDKGFELGPLLGSHHTEQDLSSLVDLWSISGLTVLDVGMFMTRRRLLSAFFLICIFAFISLSKGPSSRVSNGPYGRAIVSLASSHHRLDDELPVAIRSLTRQTVIPQEIRIYMPESDRKLVETRYTRLTSDVKPLSSWLHHSLVKILFVEDVGPATKFIPVLRTLMSQHDRGDHNALDQPVIIVGEFWRLGCPLII
jgi:hypothetical protein